MRGVEGSWGEVGGGGGELSGGGGVLFISSRLSLFYESLLRVTYTGHPLEYLHLLGSKWILRRRT